MSEAIIAEGTCGDDLVWTLDVNGVLTISGSGNMTNYSDVSEIPWYSSRLLIESVIIQSKVTSIGENAFYGCENLKTITIGKDVAKIGESAFFACISLTSIDVLETNKTYKSLQGVVYTKDGKTLVACPAGKTGKFTVSSTENKENKMSFAQGNRINCRNNTGNKSLLSVQPWLRW